MIAGAALALVLTASQVHWLNIAYDEGQRYGIAHYLEAIVLVESSACIHKTGDDGHSIGCGQLQVATARKICRCRISAHTLKVDDAVNIRLSAKYLALCFKQFTNTDRATLCYNEGPFRAAKASSNQVAKSRYVRKVKAYLRQLQQIPVDMK